MLICQVTWTNLHFPLTASLLLASVALKDLVHEEHVETVRTLPRLTDVTACILALWRVTRRRNALSDWPWVRP